MNPFTLHLALRRSRRGERRERRAADGQLHVERGARRGPRFQADAPAVLLHDGVRDGQPEARALAHFFRREEGVEDLRLHVRRDSRAIVVDLEDDRLVARVVPRADDQNASAVGRQHGLLRVDHQVQQHLLYLVPVGKHHRQACCQRVDHRDVGDALFVRSKAERLAHDVVDIHHRARRLTLAGEGEQVAHDARRPLGLAENHLEAAPHGGVERRPLAQPLRPAQDRGERVVQFVRDTRNRLAQRRHLLGLQQLVVDVPSLVVQLLALADVTDEGFDAQAAVARGRIRPSGDLHPDRGAVRPAEAEQVVGDGAVGREALHERDARLRIDKTLAVERTNLALGRVAGEAEDQLEVGIGCDRGRIVRADRPDVDALVNGLEQPGEGCGPSIHEGILRSKPLLVAGVCSRRRRRRHLARIDRGKFLVDGRTDVADRRARRVHLARTIRHVDADRALDAVLVPFDDVARGVSRSDEAIVVAPVPGVLAAAEAGDVAQDFGMFGSELVRGGDDLARTRWLVALERNGREAGLVARSELGLRFGFAHGGWRSLRGCDRGVRRA